MTNVKYPTIPEVPSLTDTRNTFALATAAKAVDSSVLAQLSRRDQEVIEKAIAGNLPNDKEYILVRVLFKADMIRLRTVRDEIVGIACDHNWLSSFGAIARTLLIDLPEPRGKGSMKQLREQRDNLYKALREARKRIVGCMERLVEREARAAEAETTDEQSEAVAEDDSTEATTVVAEEGVSSAESEANLAEDEAVAEADDSERQLVTTG